MSLAVCFRSAGTIQDQALPNESIEELSEELLNTPKCLPDDLEWRPHPTHAALMQIEAGVVDPDGRQLRGLVVILSVRCPADRRLGESWSLQLAQVNPGQRGPRVSLFRVDILRRPGIPPNHHDAPHAHRLDSRIRLPAEAASWTWSEALRYFCDQTTLALPQIDHPLADFKLTPS